jgi:UDP:flavonoid glycosyltransferase YjiC (YdhE family)
MDFGGAVVLGQEMLSYKTLGDAVNEVLQDESYLKKVKKIQLEALKLDAVDEITKRIARLSS